MTEGTGAARFSGEVPFEEVPYEELPLEELGLVELESRMQLADEVGEGGLGAKAIEISVSVSW